MWPAETSSLSLASFLKMRMMVVVRAKMMAQKSRN
jgi:hypothetical protein